ncbi:hypothetical protein GSI_04810 [Ganoderma sinense ZZ0214-1]|uniref:Uncharacterized protein n=1 Tax=Ganoderma sinense ZZ0214-1 TaxID=1077348 RepID=A0A2G8SHW0_9APHY|nr:hypothetical protein GSI_04810 [Ganoderma sinense ZZ0214-1]
MSVAATLQAASDSVFFSPMVQIQVYSAPAARPPPALLPALDGTLSIGLLDASVPEDTYSVVRALNQVAQEGGQGSGSGSRSRPVWKKLDRLVCDPRIFYILGLHSPIRLVKLDYCSPLTLARRCVEPTLRENPVPRLKISFALTEGRDVLDGLFSPELARALTHLTLVLEFAKTAGRGGRGRGDRRAPPDTLVSRLQPLHKLTHLRLVVHSNIHHDPSSGRRAYPRSTSWAPPLPTLRYVFVATSAYLAVRDPDVEAWSYRFWKMIDRWREPRGWRIDRFDSGSNSRPARERERERERGPVPVELREDVAEAIMEDEDLVLSEADNASRTLHFDEDYIASVPRQANRLSNGRSETRSSYLLWGSVTEGEMTSWTRAKRMSSSSNTYIPEEIQQP